MRRKKSPGITTGWAGGRVVIKDNGNANRIDLVDFSRLLKKVGGKVP